MECYFCKRNIKEVDFKEDALLRRFISSMGKIRAREKTGLCAKHQRRVAKSVKRSRNLGILSHTAKHPL
ncbi:MAG: 30S ribosomal protein S18 [Candidatus Parcubacteria bacterium]|nr:30S ribosomal protein S18 [Candidatus Parcubacteria bacterium]